MLKQDLRIGFAINDGGGIKCYFDIANGVVGQ